MRPARLLPLLLLGSLLVHPASGQEEQPARTGTRSIQRTPREQARPKSQPATRVLRDIQSMVRSGKYKEALDLLEGLDRETREGQTAQSLMGTCLRKLGRMDDAKALYRAAVQRLEERAEDPTAMRIELERVHREAGEPEEAFAVCLEMHRRAGGAVPWVRDEMESLIEADSLGERAVAALREEMRRRPEATDLGGLLVDALLFLGRDEEALAAAVDLDRSRNARGRVVLEHLRLLDREAKGDPSLAAAGAAIDAGLSGADLQEALYLKARALRRLGRLPAASATFEEASRARSEGPLARVCLQERADLLVRDMQDLDAGAKAQEELVAALENFPVSERGPLLSEALVALADTRLRMGRYEEAAALLARVEQEAAGPSRKADAAFEQAEILFYGGKVQEAVERYQRVVSEFGGTDRVNDALDRILLVTRVGDAEDLPLAALGQIAYQRRIGLPSRALEICLEAARECGDCPAQEELLKQESLLLIDLGRLEEAAARADTLTARFTDGNAAPMVLRAVADAMYRRDGETEAVMRRYEELLIRFPKSHEASEVRSHLETLRRTGQRILPRREEVLG